MVDSIVEVTFGVDVVAVVSVVGKTATNTEEKKGKEILQDLF